LDAGVGVVYAYDAAFEATFFAQQEEHFAISGAEVEEAGGVLIEIKFGRSKVLQDLLGGVDVGEPGLANMVWG